MSFKTKLFHSMIIKNPSAPIRWLTSLVFLTSLCSILSCGSGHQFAKAKKFSKKGKTAKADRIYQHFKNHPDYDLAAQYFLLRTATKPFRTPPAWAKADSAFADLAAKFDGISPEQAAKLKKVKVSKRKVENSQKSFQNRAIDFAKTKNSILVLDEIAVLFPIWFDTTIQKKWDSTRAFVVNRNLPTTDYDIATSILNRHRDVVYKNNFPKIWKMDEKIWDFFLAKYPICEMPRFKNDHPLHRYSKDCWFEEAAQMFCSGSLDSALIFLKTYPVSALEFEVIEFILQKIRHDDPQIAGMNSESLRFLGDVRDFIKYRKAICEPLDSLYEWRDIHAYMKNFAPSVSSFAMLILSFDNHLKSGRQRAALDLLKEMKPLFPDSTYCKSAIYDFHVGKQKWINRRIHWLENEPDSLRNWPMHNWNTVKKKEYSAVSWDEGREVFFVQNQKGTMKVQRSERQDSGWTQPKFMPSLSARGTTQPLSMTADGLQILLKTGKRLYLAKRPDENSPFGVPEKLRLGVPGMKRAVLTPDGWGIIADGVFDEATVDEKPDSDLSFYQKTARGKFKLGRDLGININTKYDEINPYLCEDGVTLLFCRDDPSDFGNLEVFVTRRLGDGWQSWSDPENLGCLTNTFFDDFGYSWVSENGKGAFFTDVDDCNKDFNIRRGDLPTHARPKKRRHLRGKVVSASGKPFTRKGYVEITFDRDSTATLVPISATGNYHFVLPDSVKTAKIYADVPGQFTETDLVHDFSTLPADATVRDTFKVLPVKVFKNGYLLKHATFDAGKINFNDPRLHHDLEMLYKFSKDMGIKTKFEVHTAGDQKLAQQRADSLRNYLIFNFKMPEKKLLAEGTASVGLPPENLSAEMKNSQTWVLVKIEIPQKALDDKWQLTENKVVTSNSIPKDAKDEDEKKGEKTGRKKKVVEATDEKSPVKKRNILFKIFRWKKYRNEKQTEKKAEEFDEEQVEDIEG